MSRPRTGALPSWGEFEQRVADLLRLQGYRVDHDRLAGGRQTDIIACVDFPGITTRVLVECKFTAGRTAVRVADVTDFCARAALGRATGRFDKGLLVTNGRFTRQAADCVHSAGAELYVRLASLADLERELIDFTSYVSLVATSFERMPVSRYMVDLACSEFLGTEDPGLWESRRDVGYATHASVRKLILEWVKEEGSNLLCVLGDYGVGKSSLCAFLTSTLAEAYLTSGKQTRLPLLIPLASFGRTGSVRAMVADWIASECDIPTGRYRAFERMLDDGRFVVILDGFDEMTSGTVPAVLRDNFRELSSLYRPASKVILTGRPEYFPSLEELDRAVIEVFGFGIGEHRLHVREGEAGAVKPKIIRLEPLDAARINAIINAREEEITAHGHSVTDLRRILDTKYDLTDLARRPVLLDIIVGTFARIGAELSAANTAELYDAYTRFWIQRDREKGRMRQLISGEEKSLFMEELAWSMYCRNSLTVHHTELPAAVASVLGVEEERTQEFAHDIMTCSFLVTDGRGSFTFAHKSFMEFFAARKVFGELRGGDRDLISKVQLTGEVAQFVAELIVSQDDWLLTDIRSILDDARLAGLTGPDQTTSLTRTYVVGASNAVMIMSWIEGAIDDADLTDVCLADARLRDKSTLAGARMDGSSFAGVRMRHCSLRGAAVGGVSWRDVDCTGMLGLATSFIDSKLTSSSFPQSAMQGAEFVRSQLDLSDFRRADLASATFLDCVCKGTSFREATLTEAVFTNCDLSNCDFVGAALDGAVFDSCDLTNARVDAAALKLARFVACKSPELVVARRRRTRRQSNT